MKEYLPVLIDRGITFLAGLMSIAVGFGWMGKDYFKNSPIRLLFFKICGPFLLIFSTCWLIAGIYDINSKKFAFDWQEYSSPQGGYSIEYPSTPIEITQKIEIDSRNNIQVHAALLDIPSLSTVYKSTYTVLPHEIQNLPEEKFLNAEISDLKQTLFPESIQFKRLEKADPPCWKITGETKNSKVALNYYVHQGKTYEVIVTFPKKQKIPPEAERFFDSFHWVNSNSTN
jgi:hypothetical protein